MANATVTAPVQIVGPSFEEIELGVLTLLEFSNLQGELGFETVLENLPNVDVPLTLASFSSVSVYNPSQQLVILGALASNNSFVFTNLMAGTYTLRASGFVDGLVRVTAQYNVSEVPEPDLLVMLLTGGVLTGFLARRRRYRADN